MERDLNYVVFVEDGAFVARCLDVEVTSEGDTEENAIASLREALELYFEDHTARPSSIVSDGALGRLGVVRIKPTV